MDPASPAARAARLVDQAGQRSRTGLQDRVERLRVLAPAVAQTAGAAAGAWLVATLVVGHTAPFFAPVAAIIALAHALEMEVVAEGVETISQLNKLQALQCDQVQGYLLAKPLVPEEIGAFLQKRDATLRAGT